MFHSHTQCHSLSKLVSNRFNQVVEAKQYEGVNVCRKVC